MTRIVVLGNSHLGALRAAWSDLSPSTPGIDLVFFGGIMPIFAAMTLDHNQVFGLHSCEGLPSEQVRRNRRLFEGDTVDLKGADAVVVVGVDWHVWTLIDLLNTHVIDGLDTEADTSMSRRLSVAAFDAITQALAADAIEKVAWAARIDAPVHLLPRPLPPESLLEPGPAGMEHSPQVLASLKRGFAEAIHQLARALNEAARAHGLMLIEQPAETRTSNGLTAASFQRDGLHLSARADGARRPDFEHMNIGYGAACIGALLARIDTNTALRAPNTTVSSHGG